MNYSTQQTINGTGFSYVSNFLTDTNPEMLDKLIMLDVIKHMTPKYTCKRPPGAAGAALLAKDGKLLYGDVRPADGSLTCNDLDECMIENGHCVRTIHAEVRAVLNAAKLGISTHGATCYSILKPCFQCTKVLIAAGISKIVYVGKAYDETRTKYAIQDSPQKIEVVQLDIDLLYGKD